MEDEKSFKSKLSNRLRAIDLFSSQIKIQIRGKDKISSPFGGFLSIVFFLLLIIPTSQLISQMINHEKPHMTQVTNFEISPGPVVLNQSENFIFALSVTVNGSLLNLNRSMFVINSSMVSIRKTANKTKIITKVPLILRQCQSKDFPVERFGQDVYLNYSMGRALCPQNLDFTITGDSSSEVFNYFQIDAYACSNRTNSSEYLCDSPERISRNWRRGEVKFNFYFSNNNIDPQDFAAPNKTFFDSFFWVMSPNFLRNTHIKINSFSIVDYISTFTSNTVVNRSMQSITPNGFVDNSRFISGGLDALASPLLSIKVQRSSYHTTAYRDYLNLGDILGYVGGLAAPILLFLSLFSRGYTNKRVEVEVVNSLYDVKTSNKKIEFDKKVIEMIERKLSVSNMTEKGSLSIKSHLMATFFKRDAISRKNINHGPLEYMKFAVPFWPLDQDEKLKQSSFEQGRNDLNVLDILRQLMDLDKLKEFLLSPDQLELFNFFARERMPPQSKVVSKKEKYYRKSEIYDQLKKMWAPDYEESHVIKKLIKTVKFHVGKSRMLNLYIAYRVVKYDRNPVNQKFNRRLLEMLDRDNLLDDFRYLDEMIESIGKENTRELTESLL